MPIRVTKKEAVSKIDSDTYEATIVGVELFKSKNPQIKKPGLRWKLLISDPTLDGEEVDDEITLMTFTGTDLTDHEQNKLRRLLVATGSDVSMGESLDVEELVGEKLRVVVEDNATDTGVFSKVTSFLPMKKKKKAAKVEEEEEDDEEEEVVKPKKKKAKKVEEVEEEDEDDDLLSDLDDD